MRLLIAEATGAEQADSAREALICQQCQAVAYRSARTVSAGHDEPSLI
jgi:hypothetical protein